MQTTTVAAIALAVAGTAFAAAPAPTKAPEAAGNAHPDPRTVTVRTTVRNGAATNGLSLAAAALAGAIGFASY
ncbi:hypothetical protein IWQ56_002116, partial [Coemansia nantahalensis]